MKLNRVLYAAAMMVAVGLFASVGAAKADTDPILHVGDPTCSGVNFTGSTVDVTLDASDSFDEGLCYTGTTTLQELTLEFVAPFGITFQFTGGTVADGGPFPDVPAYSPLYSTTLAPPCDPTAPTTPCEQWTVDFYGPPGLAPNTGVAVYETPVGNAPLVPIVVSVTAPEASTLLLLLAAIAPVLWFGRKFRGANSVA